jgi:tRNA A-37 threonylcarbamoyl transferase component Bud32
VKFGGISFGSEASDFKYDFICSHTAISYDGTIFGKGTRPDIIYGMLLDIKTPSFSGNIIRKLKPFGDRTFHEDFLIYTGDEVSIRREADILKRLFNSGFPTLEPLQEFIELDGKPAVEGVLVTRKLDNPEYLVDKLKDASNQEKIYYLEQSARALKNLHNQKVIWGDANLINMAFENRRLLLFNFSFTPNYDKPIDELKARDLESLCLSAVYRSGLTDVNEVVFSIVDAYCPSKSVKHELADVVVSNAFKDCNPVSKKIKEIFYYKPVYMLSFEKHAEASKAILRSTY